MVKSFAILALAALVYSGVVEGQRISTRKSFFDFRVKGLDGKTVVLSKYKGDVCLVVNVASY